jgi:phosphate/sulfate permease
LVLVAFDEPSTLILCLFFHRTDSSHQHSNSIEEKPDPNEDIESVPRQAQNPRANVPLAEVETSEPAYKTLAFWKNPMNPLKLAFKIISHGTSREPFFLSLADSSELGANGRLPFLLPFPFRLVDIHAVQKGKAGSKEADRLAKMHGTAVQYDNKTEHLYSFLQVLTACTASFAHGANDLANAIGPFSAIYTIWSTGNPLGKNTPTEVWQLVFGGVMLVIGLSTYGYSACFPSLLSLRF